MALTLDMPTANEDKADVSHAKSMAATQEGMAASKIETTLQHVSATVWDDAIGSFDGVCHEQLLSFAKHRWPNATHEPVLIRKGGEAVAAALMTIRQLPLGLSSIAVSKWGPILKDYTADNAQEHYAAAVQALKAEYADKRGMMLSLLPRAPRAPFINAEEILKQNDFRTGTQLFEAPDRYIVNLRLSDDELLKSFGQKWRYHLKKSKKENLVFERATPEQFKEFEKLYRIMIGRKNFDDHSAYDDTINVLMKIESPNLRPEIFFVRHEDEIVAGALIFKAGDTPEYLYGATNDKALSLRAGYFLQWNIARWLRDNTDAAWYDLGGTQNVSGLHQFKKGMVGSKGVVTPIPPLANYASHLLPNLVGNAAYTLRDLAIRLRGKVADWRKQRARS